MSFCRDCANATPPTETLTSDCTVQEHWDKRLKIGPDKGTSMFLCYGYNDHWKPAPTEQAHRLVHGSRKRKPEPRALIRAAVYGTATPKSPEVVQLPEWGYAGGYGVSGRRIKATPGTIRRQKIQEEKDCSQIAITPRRK